MTAIEILQKINWDALPWENTYYSRFMVSGLWDMDYANPYDSTKSQSFIPSTVEPITSNHINIPLKEKNLTVMWSPDCKNVKVTYYNITYVSNDLTREERTYLEDFIDQIPQRIFDAQCDKITELFGDSKETTSGDASNLDVD